ncbi:hypothetical protein [Bacillus sp. 196mf]|uniref:hypothetical protein n=1 Tax=Bacillus sp. 196mf TaxID=1761754 RepID=UPI000D7CB77A|nr:hypothetical protein [Bacillus sp. 196mf]PYE93229.1 hypothetical protein ATL10_1009191 [Bacillus sp. 196mf]
MKIFNKCLLVTFTTMLAFSYTAPSSVSYAEESRDVNTIKTEVSGLEIAKTKEIMDVIQELDRNLDMENLSNNTPEDILKLSKATQDFYYSYKNISDFHNGNVSADDVANLIASKVNENSINNNPNYAAQYAAVRSKDFYISNYQVNEVVKLAGLHGTGWGFAIALAKKFGKSPTWVTLMIVAVPALGAGAINYCNNKNKGIIINRLSFGATHTFTCRSQ